MPRSRDGCGLALLLESGAGTSLLPANLWTESTSAEKLRPFSHTKLATVEGDQVPMRLERWTPACGWPCIAFVAMLLTACGSDDPGAVVPPRAVSILQLEESDPALTLRLPGSVIPWKQEQIGFEVGGRVEWVVEADEPVIGPGSDEAYQPIPGTGNVIAQLDSSRYELALASAEANLAAAEAQVGATRVQGTEVIDGEIRAAMQEVRRAKRQFDRLVNAAPGSVARAEVDNAEAAYLTAVANEETFKARKTTLGVELKLRLAQRDQATEATRQATLDLDDTKLRAPFDAQVSQVHVTRGTFVAAGAPVVTLVVMDPVKAELVVSANRDRDLKTNDEVFVYSEFSSEPIPAIVYQKSAVASSSTRTFTVTLLCRNRRVKSQEKTDQQSVPIEGFMRPQQFDVDGAATWFVEQDCIHKDEQGYFAWQVLNPDGRPEDEPLDLERVDLTLGETRKNLFGVYRFRELIPDSRMIQALNDGGRWRMVLAAGVPGNYRGGKVIKTTPRWLLRPGDIVDVQLEDESPERGMYVPRKYIRVEEDRHFVFLVEGEQDNLTARKTPVSVTAHVGILQRIEGADIRPGCRMITSGVHYLQDGEAIDVFEVAR